MTREIFFFKNHAENDVRGLVPGLNLFFKKLYIGSKQVASTLVIIYIRRASLGHTIKPICITFQAADPEIFYERLWD